jgi:hypothetical protein
LAGAVAFSVAAGEGATTRRDLLAGEVAVALPDTRFEVMGRSSLRGAEAVGGQRPVEAGGAASEAEAARRPPRKEIASSDARPDVRAEHPVKAAAKTERVEPAAAPPSAETAPPEPQPPPTEDAVARQAGEIRAAVVKASDVNYGDLRKFIGRYEVDPKKAENFIIDITLEGGELWLKPSHSPKRRLIRQSETEFADSHFAHHFTAILDGRGRVAGLWMKFWGGHVTARKLVLPRPSLSGNVTFRLRGFADAKVVAVAGDFNNWNQSQFLFVREGGEWVCRVNLPAGAYQYKFIVDGNWLMDPQNPQTIYDRRGIENSILRTD